MESVEKCRVFTRSTLSDLRQNLNEALSDSPEKDKLTIVATGSYGREEASQESDIDLFILFDTDDSAEDRIKGELESIQQTIEKVVPNEAGDSGTFGVNAVISFSEMKTNIGGQHDSNKNLTRRMLFLLEGTWLYQEESFRKYQRSLLQRYIQNSSPDAVLPRFLLNDVIRFYRTMATDFEHKVVERGKEWGLRSIKLRFSRKLLYFAGILTIAEMIDAGFSDWEARALSLLSQPPLQRIGKLIGGECGDKVLETYDQFLAAVTDPSTRDVLGQVEKEKRNESECYQELRKLGARFSTALSGCLKERYDDDHPIHEALVF